eukprot:10794808-Alexandrium_andersonii.AAC.1
MSASLVGSEMCIRDSCSSKKPMVDVPSMWCRLQGIRQATAGRPARPRCNSQQPGVTQGDPTQQQGSSAQAQGQAGSTRPATVRARRRHRE